MMRLTFLMLFGNAIFYLIQAVSCCRILTRRFSWPVMVPGFAVGYLLFVLPAIPFPETGMIRGMIALVSFPLVDMVLFRDKWYRCLFCGVAAVLIMSAADLISAAVLLTPEQLRQGLTFQPIPVQLTSYAIFLSASAFFLWMFTLLMNRYKYRLSGREWTLYLLFPVSQCLLLYGWMMLCRLDFSANRMWILLAGLVTCVAADAALFTAVRGMAQRVELQAENDLLAQQIDHQKEHYAAITAQYENIRRIRHDIANHLYTMDLLLKEGQYAKAQDYFAEVSQVSRYKSDLGSCENPVVDTFLYARAEDLKAQGYLTEAILNYVALLGWSPKGDLAEQEIFSLDALVKAFDLTGISKSPAIFDKAKLDHFNAVYLRAMSPEDFAKAAEPYIRQSVQNPAYDPAAIAALLQARCERLTEIPEKVDFFDTLPEYPVDFYTNKKSKTNPEVCARMLEAAIPMLEALPDWTDESIHDGLVNLAASLEVKNATLMWPVRIAAAGKLVTPGGAVEICRILGREETLRRLRQGLSMLTAC